MSETVSGEELEKINGYGATCKGKKMNDTLDPKTCHTIMEIGIQNGGDTRDQ